MSNNVMMRVFAIIESADGETVALFQTRELAEQYIERLANERLTAIRRSSPNWEPYPHWHGYGIDEVEVLDALPDESSS